MTPEQLIANQQIVIEEFKERDKIISDNLTNLRFHFYGIGQPLNDNNLKFNNEQLLWVAKAMMMIERIREQVLP